MQYKRSIKFLFVVFFLYFASYCIYADMQSVHFIAGVSYSKPEDSYYSQYEGEYHIDNLGQYHPIIGAAVLFPLHRSGESWNHFGSIGLLFRKSGNRIVYDDYADSSYYLFNNFSFISFPLIFESHYRKTSTIHPVLQIGGALDILLHANQGHTTQDVVVHDGSEFIRLQITSINTRNSMKSTIMSFVLGAGIRITERVGAIFNYKYGLLDIIEKPVFKERDYYLPRELSLQVSLSMQ